MSKVITVMNMKGGVGKTTVTVHLAGVLARYNIKDIRKVLVIDYDPQFNLSQAFLKSKKYFSLEADRKTMISVLLDDGTNLNPYQLQVPGNNVPPSVKTLATNVYASKTARLDLLPSTLDLMYVALGQASAQTAPIEERFEKFIAECRTLYDVILIDCHPAGSLFTKTSLRNSDHVLIPVMPQRYAARGIALMLQFIAAKKAGETSPSPHVLINCAPRTGVTPIETSIRAAYSQHCLSTTLKKFSAFADPEEGDGFVWESTKPYSTEAFSNLMRVAREFMKRIGA